MEQHSKGVMSVAFSGDGASVATCGWDRDVRVWDVARGTCIAVLLGGGERVVALSADGATAFTGAGKILSMWDVASQRRTATFEGHTSDVFGLALAPGGAWLASCSHDGTVRLWDIASGACTAVLSDPNDSEADYDDVAVSANGQWVAATNPGRMKGRTVVWGVASQQVKHRYSVLRGNSITGVGDDGEVQEWQVGGGAFNRHSYAASPDGAWAATCSGPRVRLLEAESRNCVSVLPLPGGAGEATAVAFAPVAPSGAGGAAAAPHLMLAIGTSAGHVFWGRFCPAAASLTGDPCDTAGKFSSAGRTMTIGQPVEAVRGIWAALGIAEGGARFTAITSDGVGEITREFNTLGEHCSERDRDRFAYIFSQSASLLVQDNGVERDIGNEGKFLGDFVAHPDACQARLTTAHVLALRLYTSNSYGRINWPLRDGCTVAKPHPYAATVYYIRDAILKLRATRAADATTVRTFWRGMDNMGVADEFLKQGGTERGCLSTTEGLAVARMFAKVGVVASPLLLKLESQSLVDCGAAIAWVSMYPKEEEVLFPPLTFLRPVGEPVVDCAQVPASDGCTIVTVHPRF
jgi:hypothetical protein